MKIILSFALLFCITTAFAQPPSQPDSNFHIYLLVGQSNMAGRGPLDSLSKVVQTDIYMLD